MLNIVEKIYNFDFYIEDELKHLYDFANANNEPVEKFYEDLSNKELREIILKKYIDWYAKNIQLTIIYISAIIEK